jgi:hypothetical protein
MRKLGTRSYKPVYQLGLQALILLVVLSTIWVCGVKYQVNMFRQDFARHGFRENGLSSETEKGFDKIEKRMEQFEKNMITQFEDLKREIRASRKTK